MAGTCVRAVLATLLVVAGLMSHAEQGDTMATNNDDLRPLPNDAWRLVTDGVMGGISSGQMVTDHVDGSACVALRGRVSTANNGGFIQLAMDVSAQGTGAEAFDGLELVVHGNGDTYNVHLRTTALWLPWQSYRASFSAPAQWQTLRLPFSAFTPYRTTTALDTSALERIGLVAIGREFDADLCVASIAFYRSPR